MIVTERFLNLTVNASRTFRLQLSAYVSHKRRRCAYRPQSRSRRGRQDERSRQRGKINKRSSESFSRRKDSRESRSRIPAASVNGAVARVRARDRQRFLPLFLHPFLFLSSCGWRGRGEFPTGSTSAQKSAETPGNTL